MNDTVGDHKIAGGGLMRCCIATMERQAPDPVPQSRRIRCDHCTSGMILDGAGVWRWDRPADEGDTSGSSIAKITPATLNRWISDNSGDTP